MRDNYYSSNRKEYIFPREALLAEVTASGGWLVAVTALGLMECRIWIAARRDPGRTKRGDQRYNKKEEKPGSENHWVARRHAVKQLRSELAQSGYEAQAKSFTS